MGEGDPGRSMTVEFYGAARELTRAHGSVLLVDSIQAGLRAHGVLSIIDYPGFEKFDAPDMETYSKALNAGQYPLSVVAVTPRAAELYKKGIYGNSFQKDVSSSNLALLDKMIVDSGGNGSVLLVNAPDFPPLKPVGAAAQERIGRECPECSITLLGISAADLSGDIASNIVATVRQNPEIKYVVAAFTDLSRGLPQALKAAGLDDVKVYVVQPDDATVHLIEKGDIDAGALPPKRTFGWATVDMMARYSVGMPVLQDEVGEFNLWIWTPETMPKGQTSWDPTDYQERYKKLWQVS